jgi:hypothetical protein
MVAMSYVAMRSPELRRYAPKWFHYFFMNGRFEQSI